MGCKSENNWINTPAGRAHLARLHADPTRRRRCADALKKWNGGEENRENARRLGKTCGKFNLIRWLDEPGSKDRLSVRLLKWKQLHKGGVRAQARSGLLSRLNDDSLTVVMAVAEHLQLEWEPEFDDGSHFMDFYFPSIKTCIEFDGYEHFRCAAMEADLKRDSTMLAAGCSVVRLSKRLLYRDLGDAAVRLLSALTEISGTSAEPRVYLLG